MPKYQIEVPLVGFDGNAYAIISRIRKALERAGATPEELAQYLQESTSGDYDHLLQVATEWVEVS